MPRVFCQIVIIFVLVSYASTFRPSNLRTQAVVKDSRSPVFRRSYTRFGRKIEDEESALKNTASSSRKDGKYRGKSGNRSTSKGAANEPVNPSKSISVSANTEEVSIDGSLLDKSASSEGQDVFRNELLFAEGAAVSDSLFGEPAALENMPKKKTQTASAEGERLIPRTEPSSLRVPLGDPLQQSTVPPEVVFFGEPRRPPPVEQVGGDVKYHGNLLFWARHANVVPRTSEERLASVFPTGRLHPDAPKYRLSVEGLSYQKIFQAFENVQYDLEASKAFIASNIDLVPSVLFMRALTAQKLAFQSKNQLDKMEEMKLIREKYILAHDQIFFPLNIEILKAETRVMTYLARDELISFSKDWDSVEASLHFITLLAARLTWDEKVDEILEEIKMRLDSTIGYMRDSIRSQLLNRELRKPAMTADIYRNATAKIASQMSTGKNNLYSRIRPEVRVLYETYNMVDPEEIKRYITKEFCTRPETGVAIDLLREDLKILDASLAAIQGVHYVGLRLRTRFIYESICNDVDPLKTEKWYLDLVKDGYGFETYEPDEIPTIIQGEQRLRDTGNAFSNFEVEVMKGPTKYSSAFSGERPKGRDVGNWLRRDPDWESPQVTSYEERIEVFRQAYITQTNLRLLAENALDGAVDEKLSAEDKMLAAKRKQERMSLILQIADEEDGIDNSSNSVVG